MYKDKALAIAGALLVIAIKAVTCSLQSLRFGTGAKILFFIFNIFDGMSAPDFIIYSASPISSIFIKMGITSFAQAADYIKTLPYGRNTDKTDLITVFTDQRGTCSTKHALLKELAIENKYDDIELMMGIFRMNGTNSPKVAPILTHYGVTYIPEAHNYLKYKGNVLDYTLPGNNVLDFEDDLMIEIAISSTQITAFKIAWHKDFLQNWLKENPLIPYSLQEIWNIREACIAALSGQNFINKT